MKFYITKHCKNRYIERVLNGLNTSDNILFTIFNELNCANNITSKISTDAPRFILYLKERYGNQGYNILKYNNIIFICIKRKNTIDLYDVVTCYIDIDSINMFKHSTLSNDEIYLKLSMLKNK